jgi:hypothetical protein
MTAERDLDTILAAWLDEGPTDLPDATRRAIVTALPTTTQARRGRLAPWRLFDMNGFGRLAAAALAVAVAIGGLIYVVYPNPGPGTPSPSPGAPSPSPGAPSPSPATTQAPTIELAEFTSTRYGYTVRYPAGWSTRPATESWPAGTIVDPNRTDSDQFRPSTSPAAIIAIAAQAVPDGTPAASWLADYAALRESTGGPCFGPASAWTDATVAGSPARRIQAPCAADAGALEFVEYAFIVDGTAYVITGNVPSVVETMIATMQPAASPGLAGRWRSDGAGDAATLELTASTYELTYFGFGGGSIEIDGDAIEFNETAFTGSNPCPGLGRYLWTVEGDTLRFVADGVDPCPSRREALDGQAFSRLG